MHIKDIVGRNTVFFVYLLNKKKSVKPLETADNQKDKYY